MVFPWSGGRRLGAGEAGREIVIHGVESCSG